MLVAAGRKAFDAQRLVFFDYLLIHSGDLDGPDSLHPETPLQRGEPLVRRKLLQDGLDLLRSRELVERRFQRSGIVYAATLLGRHIAREFDSEYAQMLRERAEWVITAFGSSTDKELTDSPAPAGRSGRGRADR